MNIKNKSNNLKLELKLLNAMRRIREVELRIAKEYPKQKIRCPVHLSVGQEAPSAIVGGGFIALARRGIERQIREQTKRNADRLEKGELDLETSGVFSRTGRIAKLAAVSGIAEAVAEASRLYAGKLTGRNPRMSDYQIFKKSGLAAAYAAAGEFGG